VSDTRAGLSPAPGVQVKLGLLDGWVHIDPRDAGNVEQLLVVLRDGLRVASEEAPSGAVDAVDPEPVVLAIAEMLGSLATAGVAMYAWWTALAQDRGEPVLLMAGAALAVLHVPAASLRTQAAGLKVLAGDDPSDGTTGQIPRRRLVELAGGTALRVRRSATLAAYGNTNPIEQVLVQYILPVDDAPSVAVVTFATPSVHYADRLQPMFDEIAKTLTVSSVPGSPTTG